MTDFGALDEVELDSARIEHIREALEQGNPLRVKSLLAPLHAADIADLLEQIDPDERRALLARSMARCSRNSTRRSARR